MFSNLLKILIFLPLTKNPIKVSKKDLMEIIKRVKN